jgi:hypothetical protein
VLAVEVLSPSGRLNRSQPQARRLRANGHSQLLVLDPDVPDLLVLELDEGRYREVVRAAGDEVFKAQRPFPVSVVPSELLGRLRPR